MVFGACVCVSLCVDHHASEPLIVDKRSILGFGRQGCVGVLLYDTSGFAGGRIFYHFFR